MDKFRSRAVSIEGGNPHLNTIPYFLSPVTYDLK